eukprot:SAG31_NODE_75_length_27561_cov_28.859333_7_plen_71_part_00
MTNIIYGIRSKKLSHGCENSKGELKGHVLVRTYIIRLHGSSDLLHLGKERGLLLVATCVVPNSKPRHQNY